MTSRTFRQATILFLLAALSLPLFACALSDAVQKVAELIDKAACRVLCRRAEMKFYEYSYWKDRCDCKNTNGDIITLY